MGLISSLQNRKIITSAKPKTSATKASPKALSCYIAEQLAGKSRRWSFERAGLPSRAASLGKRCKARLKPRPFKTPPAITNAFPQACEALFHPKSGAFIVGQIFNPGPSTTSRLL